MPDIRQGTAPLKVPPPPPPPPPKPPKPPAGGELGKPGGEGNKLGGEAGKLGGDLTQLGKGGAEALGGGAKALGGAFGELDFDKIVLGGKIGAEAQAEGPRVPSPPANAAEARQRAEELRDRGVAGETTDQDTTITRDLIDANQPLTADEQAMFGAQLEANKGLEDAALARMSPADRAAYERVAVRLAATPDARLSLQLLAMEGKLPGPNSATNPDRLDHGALSNWWHDRPPGDNLLGALDKLTDPARTPLAEGLDRNAMLRDVVNEVAHPESINQHNRGSCSVTTAQMLLAARNPAEYVRLATGLASPTGEVRMASGETLRREPDSLDEAIASGRTIAGRLMQPALMELGNGGLDYDNTMQNEAYYQIVHDAWAARKQAAEQAGTEFTEPEPERNEDRHSDGSGGLSSDELRRAMTGLFGEGNVRTISLDEGADWRDSVRSWFSDNEQADRADLVDEIHEAVRDGKPVTIGMEWGGRDADGRVHGGHQLVVTGMDDQNVTLRNPWGREETMTRAEFDRRVFSAQILD